MPTLKALVASPAVRKAALALVLAILTALGVQLSGCSRLGPAPNAPHLAVFECQLAAMEEVVPREAAEDLVMAARAGNIEYVIKQLLALGVKPQDIQPLAEAFDACSAPAALPADPEPELEESLRARQEQLLRQDG